MKLNDSPEKPFIVLYDTGDLAVKTSREVSHMYDLSDCDYMDGVKAVYAVSQECELVPVTLGETVKDDDPGSNSIVYAYTKIMAGTRHVGTVHWTDH